MKQFVLILSLLLSLQTTVNAQTTVSRGEELMKQAQDNLGQKEYIKARYFFLQAYSAFAAKDTYAKAIECGVQAAALYHRENYYKEAYELCRTMEQFLQNGEQKQEKAFPELYFLINKERLRMYMAQKRTTLAKETLSKLEENAKAANNSALDEELLYTQVNYYYTIGMSEQGDAYFAKLVGQYGGRENAAKIDECYRNVINMAKKANNAALVVYTYDKYMAWTDSIKVLDAEAKLKVLQQKYDESQETIQEKDDALSAKQYIIIGLCVLAVILAGVLIVVATALLRSILLTRKQKKAISIANEHNELKTRFIQNISAQMGPTLDTLDATHPGVQALHKFAEHIQMLSDLESSLSEMYEMQTVQVNPLCEELMERIKPNLQMEVSATVNAPKLSIKTNPQQLEYILMHLLNNAAEFTPEYGRVSLEFKRRGASTQQFIVTDTGSGISKEARENLFKPFTEVKDLTQGDGLGLPICSLMAVKMNGTLTLDESYTKGCRFVLELRTR